MKKFTFSFAAILCLSSLIIFSCGKDDPDPVVDNTPTVGPNQFIDTRDNQVYNTVKIGDQVWMAENLNYNAEGSKCYADNPDSCAKYGKLYTTTHLENIAPAGWHVPTDAEWKILEKHYGMTDAEVEIRSETATVRGTRGDSLKPGTAFNGLFAGSYFSASFQRIGTHANFWSSEDISRGISTTYKEITHFEYAGSTTRFLSVRCIKN